MRRAMVVTAGSVILAWAVVALFGAPIMPTYLAMWLIFLAVPAGALPLVMGLELAGRGGSLHTGFLRWLLLLMPAAALAGVPVLIFVSTLYPWAMHHAGGFSGAWFSPGWFVVRAVIILVAWIALSLACMQPPSARPRIGRCTAGLAIHAGLVTVVAIDWVVSLSPGLNAAGFGLLFMASQCGVALCVGLLLCRALPPGAVGLLLVASSVWAVLHMIQYLVIWSADKPSEIVWYLQRGGTFGETAVWLGVVAVVVPLAVLGVAGVQGRRDVLKGCAALLLASHMTEMLWLVTPSSRGVFTLLLADGVGVFCLALLSVMLVWAWQPRQVAA